jgi:hypothetical protein
MRTFQKLLGFFQHFLLQLLLSLLGFLGRFLLVFDLFVGCVGFVGCVIVAGTMLALLFVTAFVLRIL